MHQPGVPEDLDRPEEMRHRAAALALVAAAGVRPAEFHADEDGVRCENPGSGWWWQLAVRPDGRAVLYGQDPDGSHTHADDQQIDFLAGAPDWLPHEDLADLAEGNELGFVYWTEAGTWTRIAYPEGHLDDGLVCTDMLVTDRECLDFASECPRAGELLAGVREGRLPAALVEALLDAAGAGGKDPRRAEQSRAELLRTAEALGVAVER
ncbi:hypothetical protein [Kitasatospora camelliae]|uniref:SUKH-4 immunity protein of toxin-antitoxin system n=1 Tax=Kitasatospora camelliae TaxID=3156397 RepID=A0AAU8K5B2_9ACTN